MSSTELFATTLARPGNGAGVALSDALSLKEGKGEKVKMKINEVIQEMDNEVRREWQHDISTMAINSIDSMGLLSNIVQKTEFFFL